MSSVHENLIAAKALIDTPQKWTKGHYQFGDCFCSLGALGCVLEMTPSDDMGGNEIALGMALPADFEPDSELTVGTKVVNYNDHPETTHADIMALFDRAIAAAEPTP